MKNTSFYILAILVLGLIGNPISHQALNSQYKIADNLNVLGVNAFAESGNETEHDSDIQDNEQENDQDDQSNSEDQSENDTDNESEDNTNDQSENDTDNESEDNTNDQSEDNESEDNTDDQSEDNVDDKQQSETKTEQLISKLEQKITQLEQRIQSLLEKVQNGQYFGNLENTDQTTKSYMMSFDGIATSMQDESVSAPVSANIFVETLVTKDGYGKLRVTGGQIDIGQTTYDIVFGKARVTNSQSDQGSFILLVAEVMDDNGDITTIRMNLDSAQSFQMADTQPIDLQIDNQRSKIAGQWLLEGTGSLSS